MPATPPRHSCHGTGSGTPFTHQGWGQRQSPSRCCSEQIQRQPRGILWGARSRPSWKLFVEGYQETVWGGEEE